MKSRNYSESEKFAAVERFLVGGESVATIAADTGISRSTLYAWIKSAQIEPGMLEFTRKNFRMLEAKVKRLEGIVEILQIANCTANAPLNEKLQALEELHGQYNVYILCDALKVPRGTFYNYIFRNKRDNTWYAKRREELRIRIQQIYDESKQIFGAGKITAVMKEEGYKVSQEMVRELMRDMGLLSIRQDAKKVYAKERRSLKNHLNQQFEVTRPNEVWVSDVTYFLCKDIKFYICAIIDLYARRIVGYRVGKRNSTQLVKSTFKQAYESRKPAGQLLFHADRGSNYRSYAMCSYLREFGVIQSYIHQYGTGVQIDQSGGQNCESRQCTYDHSVSEYLEDAPHTLTYGLFYVGTGMHHNGGTKTGFVREHATLHTPGQRQFYTGTHDTSAYGFQPEGTFEDCGKYSTDMTDIGEEDHKSSKDISDGHKRHQLLRHGSDSF